MYVVCDTVLFVLSNDCDFLWYRYHCHTCKLVDGTGVCTVCAKVCHKGHELSYSKCGSFFCDCGAKEDKSCQALVKRGTGTAGSAAASEDSQSFAVPFGSPTTKKTKKSNKLSFPRSLFIEFIMHNT